MEVIFFYIFLQRKNMQMGFTEKNVCVVWKIVYLSKNKTELWYVLSSQNIFHY